MSKDDKYTAPVVIGDLLSLRFRYAKHGGKRTFPSAELLQRGHGKYGQLADLPAFECRVNVENACQPTASGIEIDMHGYRPAQVARADDYRSELPVNAQYPADLAAKLRDVVAVSLLSESAEIIKILSYL